MTELSSRRQRERRGSERPTIACFCESCDRVLYVAISDELFCPVCSSALMPAEGWLSEIDMRDGSAAPHS